MKLVRRREDMSAVGHLVLLQDNDGDMIIAVYADDHNAGKVTSFADVEFCTIGTGGGKSPHTLEALRNLMKAIELDNEEYPAGRHPYYEDEGWQE